MSVAEVPLRRVAGIRSGLEHLLPGCEVTTRVVDRPELPEGNMPERLQAGVGSVMADNEVTFWVALGEGKVGTLTISRDFLPFSEAEEDLLTHIEETLRSIPFTTGEDEGPQAELVANPHAFERMVTVQHLRGELHRGLDFWTPGRVIDQLMDLAMGRYEQQATMSGIVVVSHPKDFQDQIEGSCYEFEAFPEHIEMGQSFFDRPSSHRYVDGKSAMYLVDHRLEVHGVLRCTDPSRFGRVARAANEHLAPLLEIDASEVWAGYVGNNRDVNMVVTPRNHLRWLKSHWHFVDQYHLSHTLEQQGFAKTEIEDVVAILLGVADFRRGTLILIPDDKEHLPETAGYIDDSKLGTTLHRSLVDRKMSELRRRRVALGMLTSDGLTTVAKSGRILGCGQIVCVDRVSEEKQPAGGGRTQAAIVASRYGLVIKISQDGPISFFKNEREQIRIVL